MSDIKRLTEQLVKGDRRALSRAITLVESSHPKDRKQALDLLDAIMPHTQNSTRIGISGSPGVGKSTFIEAYGQHLIESGQRIAALTIDPSSKLTGGSILGDKTRMPVLSNHPDAFIRPTPSGSLLGGVARRSREVIALCEAAGFDTILIETVGVGQSETEVANMTDCYLLLLQPGSGDTLQGIKRGIMELADIIVVNKADGKLLAAARESATHYLRALTYLASKLPDWKRPVILCSSTENTGMEEVNAQVSAYLNLAKDKGVFTQKRKDQRLSWLEDETIAELVGRFKTDNEIQTQYKKITQQIEQGQSPARVAARFVDKLIRR
jgi:LAO/AO transport system kinase